MATKRKITNSERIVLMFKNKQQEAQQLLERLRNDRVGERTVKIISLSEKENQIANYLKEKLLNNQPKEKGEIVIIADEGSVGFSRLRGKINQLRQEKAKQILIAMPVYEHEKARELEKHADGVYILEQPKVFMSADDFYQENSTN